MTNRPNRTARRIAGAIIMATLVLAGYTQRASAQNSVKAGKTTKARATKQPAKPNKEIPGAEQPVWPVDSPTPLPGAILPAKRIVAFYGVPISKRMGILGELPPDEMLAKLDKEVAAWNKADPSTPVQPALHMIAVVASNTPGTSGKYRTRMDSAMIEQVYGWAHKRNALLFLDIQVGQGTVQEELPRLAKFLRRPDVHLGIDPEFSMKHHEVPGTVIGTLDAADVNFASNFLATLVDSEHLPPKVLVIHRFRRAMLTGYKKIKLDPRVQVVINMDGWGPESQKLDSYREYVWKYPVEYTGFKLFYKNDKKKKGSVMMTPAEVLALNPRPFYIQYQ